VNRFTVPLALLAAAGFGQQAVRPAGEPAADQRVRPTTIVIGAERLAQTPLDKRIYGALLEHIGQQMDTMWAELLQDNSFEGLRPFSAESERWAEGKIDSHQFSKGRRGELFHQTRFALLLPQNFAIDLRAARFDGSPPDAVVQLNPRVDHLIATPVVLGDHSPLRVDHQAALRMHKRQIHAILVGPCAHHHIVHLAIHPVRRYQDQLGAFDSQNARGLGKLAVQTY
jgi:hypothetical protein